MLSIDGGKILGAKGSWRLQRTALGAADWPDGINTDCDHIGFESRLVPCSTDTSDFQALSSRQNTSTTYSVSSRPVARLVQLTEVD